MCIPTLTVEVNWASFLQISGSLLPWNNPILTQKQSPSTSKCRVNLPSFLLCCDLCNWRVTVSARNICTFFCLLNLREMFHQQRIQGRFLSCGGCLFHPVLLLLGVCAGVWITMVYREESSYELKFVFLVVWLYFLPCYMKKGCLRCNQKFYIYLYIYYK